MFKILKWSLLILCSPIAVLAGISLGLYISCGWTYLSIMEIKVKGIK